VDLRTPVNFPKSRCAKGLGNGRSAPYPSRCGRASRAKSWDRATRARPAPASADALLAALHRPSLD